MNEKKTMKVSKKGYTPLLAVYERSKENSNLAKKMSMTLNKVTVSKSNKSVSYAEACVKIILVKLKI